MGNELILIVDDDHDINEMICLYLENDGYTVMQAHSGEEALEYVLNNDFDMILLDIMLPDVTGIELCKKIRKFTFCPIFFISCKDAEIDKIIGLECGGDDYITKPFSPKELTARIKAHLRRRTYSLITSDSSNDKKLLKFPNLTIDLKNYTVFTNNESIPLSVKEFELLTFLATHPNTIFSLEDLYDEIWETQSFGDTRTVMVHISNLRKKIEKNNTNPQFIVNIRGAGYKFNLPQNF